MKTWRGMKVYEKQEDYPDPDQGDVAILVCAAAGRTEFTDNVYTSCKQCGKAIMHRPHVPDKCIKLCGPCAFARAEKAKEEGDEVKVAVTQKTVDEVTSWQKKTLKWSQE